MGACIGIRGSSVADGPSATRPEIPESLDIYPTCPTSDTPDLPSSQPRLSSTDHHVHLTPLPWARRIFDRSCLGSGTSAIRATRIRRVFSETQRAELANDLESSTQANHVPSSPPGSIGPPRSAMSSSASSYSTQTTSEHPPHSRRCTSASISASLIRYKPPHRLG